MTISNTHIMYILIISVAYILVWLSSIFKEKNTILEIKKTIHISIFQSFFVLLSYLVLLIPLVIRKCGTDTLQYYKTYLSDDTSGLDFVFYLLCKTMHGLIPNPRVGLGIISAITLSLMFFAFLKIKDKIDYKYAFFAYLTCMYFYLYNYMRMMFAVSFVLVAYAYLINEERKKAYLFFSLAILFHRSALIVFLFFVFIDLMYKYKKLILAVSIVGIGMFIAAPSFFLGLITIERYSEQVTGDTSGGIGFGTFIITLPFFLILFIYKKYSNEKVYNYALFFTVASFGFSMLGYFVDSASRLSNMYFVFQNLFFVPWLIKREEQGTVKNIFLIGFFVIYNIMKYYLLTNNFEAMGILPYR